MKIKSIVALCLSVVFGAGIFAGVRANNDIDITKNAAVETSYASIIRLYVDCDWSDLSNFTVNNGGYNLVESSTNPEEYDVSLGQYVIDINSTTNWQFIVFSFQQKEGSTTYTWKPITTNTGTNVLSTDQTNMAKSAFKPGYVYKICDIGWSSTSGTTKYFNYSCYGAAQLSERRDYYFSAELTDDAKDYQYISGSEGFIFDDDTINLDLRSASGNWLQSTPTFRAWIWGKTGSPDKWIYFNDDNGDKIYQANGAKGYASIIFLRASAGSSDWGGEWNRVETTIDWSGKKNRMAFKITGWSSGTWSTFNTVNSVAANGINNFFHAFDSTTGMIVTTWLSNNAKGTQPTVVYKGASTTLVKTFHISVRISLDKFIFVSQINSYDYKVTQSSEIAITDYGNNVYGGTITSNIYDVTNAAISTNSKDKTLATAFLDKFSQLTSERVADNICTATVNNPTLYKEVYNIYNSFYHATYVDSIVDSGDASGGTIYKTMEWLAFRYGNGSSLKEPNGTRKNILAESNDTAFITLIITISTLFVLTAIFIRRKQTNK